MEGEGGKEKEPGKIKMEARRHACVGRRRRRHCHSLVVLGAVCCGLGEAAHLRASERGLFGIHGGGEGAPAGLPPQDAAVLHTNPVGGTFPLPARTCRMGLDPSGVQTVSEKDENLAGKSASGL